MSTISPVTVLSRCVEFFFVVFVLMRERRQCERGNKAEATRNPSKLAELSIGGLNHDANVPPDSAARQCALVHCALLDQIGELREEITERRAGRARLRDDIAR